MTNGAPTMPEQIDAPRNYRRIEPVASCANCKSANLVCDGALYCWYCKLSEAKVAISDRHPVQPAQHVCDSHEWAPDAGAVGAGEGS